MRYKNIFLLALVVFLAAVPLWMNHDAEFAGADSQAEQAITETQPDYQPWFEPVWEPPSGEIESLLFVLQAAIGAGFVGYFVGSARMRKKMSDELKKS